MLFPKTLDHYYVFSWNVFRLTDDNYNEYVSETFGPLAMFHRGPKHKRVARTWWEADNMCKSINGHLPMLRNRDELNELIALMKLSKFLPPVEFLYIGLNDDSTREREPKVNCTFFSF